jgi:hypothetical protein
MIRPLPLILCGALTLLATLLVGVASAAPTPASGLQCVAEPTARLDDSGKEAAGSTGPAGSRRRGIGAGQDPNLEAAARPTPKGPVAIMLPGAANGVLRREGREALLAFPRALPPIDAQALADCAGGMLVGVSVGYDTLLLSLAPDVTLIRVETEGGLHLVLQRASAGVAPGDEAQAANSAPLAGATPAEDSGGFRLRLLQAQLLAQTGQLAAARERFEVLRREMPESPEPLSGSAGLALQTGRWRQALAYYQDALLLDPEAPAIAAAIGAIERAAGRRLRADIEYRETEGGLGTGKATAIIGGISGQQPFGEGWRLGFAGDVAQIDAAQVQRSNGTVGPFSGERQRAELFLQHDSVGGRVVIGSLFASGDTLGAGLRAEFPDDYGVTGLRAEYRRPNWDFFQSMIDHGTRDRVAIGRRHRLTNDLTGRLEVGANRYGIEGDRDAAKTASVTGELRLGDLAGLRGLSTAYVFDGEYVLRRSEQTDPTGQRFAPLQILDREVHAIILSYAGAWGDNAVGLLTTDVSGGYGVDRYGKAGPLFSGALGYARNRFEVRLRGSYVENIGRARGTTTVFGLALTWSL